MTVAWIVVANRSLVRVFEARKRNGPLKEVATLTHPEARLRDRDVVSDAPGRQFGSGAGDRHGVNGGQDIRAHDSEKFSKEVAQWLDQACQKHAYEKLYLVVDPYFMGKLRDELTPQTRSLVAGEVSKNLVAEPDQQLKDRLAELL